MTMCNYIGVIDEGRLILVTHYSNDGKGCKWEADCPPMHFPHSVAVTLVEDLVLQGRRAFVIETAIELNTQVFLGG